MNDIDLLIDPYRGLTDEERIVAVIIQLVAYILSLSAALVNHISFFCRFSEEEFD